MPFYAGSERDNAFVSQDAMAEMMPFGKMMVLLVKRDILQPDIPKNT